MFNPLALILLACLGVALLLLWQGAKLRRPGQPPRAQWPIDPNAFVSHYDDPSEAKKNGGRNAHQ